MRKREWDNESHAAEIVCHFLRGDWTKVDAGGGPQALHDFDVVLENGATVAVEVTRANKPSHLAALSAVEDRDWTFPSLRYDWIVDMAQPFDVRLVHDKISSLIEALEAVGVETVHIGRQSEKVLRHGETIDGTEIRSTVKSLRKLGARLIHRFTEGKPGGGEVILGEAPTASSTAPSVVVETIERHAWLPDNLKKLSAAHDRTERHLFVWLETSMPTVVAAHSFVEVSDDGHLRIRDPELPATIDAAWAVTAFERAHTWHFRRGQGWRDLGYFSRKRETSCD